MSKIRNFQNTDCEYSCSMDEDILLSEHLWDYMIENVNILDNSENLFLAPLISNGIPSVEFFIRDFCSLDEKIELYKMFSNTNIPSLWGADYRHLNNSELKNIWNVDLYYDLVSNINHFYKGIHPVRVSFENHMKINEFISNKLEYFLSKQKYSLEFVKRPYFCNSFYFIKTDIWRTIVNDKSLICDGFDEVMLNQYKDKHNLNMVFVKNGFCLHMAYNTIAQQQTVEKFCYEKILSKI